MLGLGSYMQSGPSLLMDGLRGFERLSLSMDGLRGFERLSLSMDGLRGFVTDLVCQWMG